MRMTKNVILALAAGAFLMNAFPKHTSDGRVVINNSNFAAEVKQSKKPVLVEFSAPWCRACHTIDPHLLAISNEHTDIVVAKVNVDENQALAERFGISAYPTLVLFKGGEEVSWLTGSVPKAEIEAFIARNK